LRQRPPSGRKTNESMRAGTLIVADQSVHPLIALGAFSLDFLCVHPFRDGNGRVSRLLLLLQSCQVGLEVGRYISLERLIEQNVERQYETLEIGSQDGTKDTTIPGRTSVTCFSSSRRRSGNSKKRSGEVKSSQGMLTIVDVC
jgi:Fic family protein